MPKISKAKKLKQARGAQIRLLNCPKPTPALYPYYRRDKYHKTNIDLWIDLDGTLWEFSNSFRPAKPPLINDFLSFCLKICQRVSFFTARTARFAMEALNSMCDTNLLAKIKLYSAHDQLHYGERYYKVISHSEFDAFNTLIIDDSPYCYVQQQFNNIICPVQLGTNRKPTYDAIVALLESRRRSHSIPAHIATFSKTCSVLAKPPGQARVQLNYNRELVPLEEDGDVLATRFRRSK